MRRARNSILLTILANRYGSDKGDKARGRHCLFCSKRLEPIAFLEIGLLHPFDTDGVATRAPSLQMWREYFPHARLFGFDINDFSMVALPNCTIFRGDMGSRAAIEKIAIPKTRSLCRDFRSSGTFRSPVITDRESAYLAENIESIDLFDSMDRYNIDNKDGLAVITKRRKVAAPYDGA
jgi:hypothetical protein